MIMNSNEMMKLFDFILENKNIIISDNGLFSRDTLTMIRAIVKGKIPNDFQLNSEQLKVIIEAFLKSKNAFDDETPSFILNNSDCIKEAIKRSIYSADFIENYTPELSKKILNIAINKKYILSSTSPDFLKRNFNIALFSIKKDPELANFVDWDSMKKENINILIDETIKAGYMLSPNSCQFLKDNPDIVLNSIKIDYDTLSWASHKAKNHPEIFKYLISIKHEFSKRELKDKPIYTYTDKDSMKYVLEKLEILDKEDYSFDECFNDEFCDKDEKMDIYINRISELYSKAIKALPTINNFNDILHVCTEIKWNQHRNGNLDDYANIFGKICIELKNNDNFDDAINELNFMEKMKKALDEKYNLLILAMEEYHSIMHSDNKMNNIDNSRDKIAKLSALYVAVSKENYKKEKLEEYFEDIKDYFIPKKTNPIILKKLIDYKHKKVFKELYENKDEDINEFLKNIVTQYNESLNTSTIWSMINNFLINDFAKLDKFIKAPKGWNNYKRLKEANKLINRLNNNYIKYTDLELVRFLDIIKYDSNNNIYYYEGPSFDEESIMRYEEYQKKLQIFDKIKQQIIFKAKKLDINDEITEHDLWDIASDLPFNDEYFEFDKRNIESFEFDDFINGCIDKNDYIEPASLIDNDAYSLLEKYAIDNGLFWMLLLLDKHGNNSLYDIGMDKDSILSSFDYMKEVSILSKSFDYDINKFEDVLELSELSECADDVSISILGTEVIRKLCKYREYTSEDAQEIVRMGKELYCEMIKRDKSAVPYVSGKTNNYEYSIYDSQDETILISGINTNACFRIDGNDNDFLHYCALDKNGFVIKITDSFGNFIGRASGFRNGNGVYINQLRTIYDEGGYGYEGNYESERNEIIDTFRKVCNDIVETSQNNPDEKTKIDFVVVTRSYALRNTESNVDDNVWDKIGTDPMDTESEDWEDFINNTLNLQEVEDTIDRFSTDYGEYPLICMASHKGKKLQVKDIKKKDVDAVYSRVRNKIIGTDKPDEDILNKINKINAINSYYNSIDFEIIKIPENSIVFVGDNWFIIYNNGKIVDSCLLDFDNKAKIEFEATKQTINQYTSVNTKYIDYEQIIENIEKENSVNYQKVKI